MQKILSSMRKAIHDYAMIQDGDHIVVGLSGGKDSILLLNALSLYRKFSPEKYTLSAVTIDVGFKETSQSEIDNLVEFCKNIDVDYKRVKTDIAEIVFDVRKESNPCSLCAKMRRGALNNAIKEMGANKLALGHNADDVIETMMMSLIFEGRFSTLQPTAYMDRMGVAMIRPLIYLEESIIRPTVERLNLPIVNNPCPSNHNSRREWTKLLLQKLDDEVPNTKKNIENAIFHPERNNLWTPINFEEKTEK